MWKNPDIDPSAFIAPSADIYGDVSIAENCSIWFHATVRAGAGSVSIGAGTNVQDNCVIHVDKGYSVTVGKNVTIGHSAIVHGCSVGDNTLIGMGCNYLKRRVRRQKLYRWSRSAGDAEYADSGGLTGLWKPCQNHPQCNGSGNHLQSGKCSPLCPGRTGICKTSGERK